MQINVTIGDDATGFYHAALEKPLDISIPVRFDDAQLAAFGGRPARREAYTTGSFIGDVRQGGSCNCEIYSFSPHLNGTHTEGVGHITGERHAVHDIATENLVAATLATVQPVPALSTQDAYTPRLQPDDMVISKEAVAQALDAANPLFAGALVIRTLPNTPEKSRRDYGAEPPAFFTADAMREIVSRGVRHLLVDLPSIDRADDEGRLTCHRLFWDVPAGETSVKKPSAKTVTELIYVPEDVADGSYLLNLQIAAFQADAAPSRPVLYKVIRL
jgi:kynurenine formamidase